MKLKITLVLLACVLSSMFLVGCSESSSNNPPAGTNVPGTNAAPAK